jgi:hypothetical protein
MSFCFFFNAIAQKVLSEEAHESLKKRQYETLCFLVTPDFKAKPNAHSMCAEQSSFHAYPTENGYRITNVIIYHIDYMNKVFNKRLDRSKHYSKKTP